MRRFMSINVIPVAFDGTGIPGRLDVSAEGLDGLLPDRGVLRTNVIRLPDHDADGTVSTKPDAALHDGPRQHRPTIDEQDGAPTRAAITRLITKVLGPHRLGCRRHCAINH